MNWTDERVERLKRLWAEGLSASQIAAQLGGVSRNAVIGKVHRLNLPGRVKAGGPATTTRAPKRPAAATPAARPTTFAARPAAAASASAAPTNRPVSRPANIISSSDSMDLTVLEPVELTPVNDRAMPQARRLVLTELTERTCKWPVGDPLKEDFHFCGAEACDGSPYCKYHARMAYQPVTERRKAANAVARG